MSRLALLGLLSVFIGSPVSIVEAVSLLEKEGEQMNNGEVVQSLGKQSAASDSEEEALRKLDMEEDDDDDDSEENEDVSENEEDDDARQLKTLDAELDVEDRAADQESELQVRQLRKFTCYYQYRAPGKRGSGCKISYRNWYGTSCCAKSKHCRYTDKTVIGRNVFVKKSHSAAQKAAQNYCDGGYRR